MVKRRRGRPRKPGKRYRSGKLVKIHENPLTTARGQPHRRGLGEQVLDQRAESFVGRLFLREALTEVQLLAAERYRELWRSYIGTLGGPAWPGKGAGRVSGCSGCPTARERRNCACDLASRSWRHCWERLTAVGAQVLVTRVVCYDDPLPPEHFGLFCTGLDVLAFQLGLTNHRKRNYLNASFQSTVPKR